MSIRHFTVFPALLVVCTLLATVAFAQDFSFKPFSDVTNVCPTCEPPAADVITLKNGQEVRGEVVAVNPSFYTVVRYGEVRTVSRDQAQEVKWLQGSQPASLNKLDQIVLKNGHVLTGTIVVDNVLPPYFQIKSSYMEQTYTVFKSQVAKAFKAGQPFDHVKAQSDAEAARAKDKQ